MSRQLLQPAHVLCSVMFLSPTNSISIKLFNNEYTFTPFKIFISILMVVTGSINTLSVKGADMMEAVNSAGEYVTFNHPFFQVLQKNIKNRFVNQAKLAMMSKSSSIVF